MSIYSMEKEALQGLANELAQCRPSVGRIVMVRMSQHGRKNAKVAGKVGKVIWHGVDRFSDAGRYGDSYAQFSREVRGRYGYRVRVQPLDGSEAFFVSADDVIVCLDN